MIFKVLAVRDFGNTLSLSPSDRIAYITQRLQSGLKDRFERDKFLRELATLVNPNEVGCPTSDGEDLQLWESLQLERRLSDTQHIGAVKPAGSLYHVTYTNKTDAIKKKGILPMQTSNWVKTHGGERYGQGEIYAFTDYADAVRWAMKMDWEFNKSFGTGKIAIVKFKPEGEWDVDTNDPLSQAGSKGKWVKSFSSVKPQNIESIQPLTPDVARGKFGAAKRVYRDGSGEYRWEAGKEFGFADDKDSADAAAEAALERQKKRKKKKADGVMNSKALYEAALGEHPFKDVYDMLGIHPEQLPREGTRERRMIDLALDVISTPDADPQDQMLAKKVLTHHGLAKEANMEEQKKNDDCTNCKGTGTVVPNDESVIKETCMSCLGTRKQFNHTAGFNLFFPGQALEQFYPEIQHEIVEYPNANNSPMVAPEISMNNPQDIEDAVEGTFKQLPTVAFVSTSPAGAAGIGRDGKTQVLDGAPLRKENDIRGPMFMEEFYAQNDGIPGAALAVMAHKVAAADEQRQLELFLKKVMGEIAASFVAAFKVTNRPLLDKVPGVGEVQLAQVEKPSELMYNIVNTGSRVKYLLEKLTDSEIQDAINKAWSQAAVWHDDPDGGFVYEVFCRAESIDTDSMIMKYRFVVGTKE
jgi:hypothetical protein